VFCNRFLCVFAVAVCRGLKGLPALTFLQVVKGVLQHSYKAVGHSVWPAVAVGNAMASCLVAKAQVDRSRAGHCSCLHRGALAQAMCSFAGRHLAIMLGWAGAMTVTSCHCVCSAGSCRSSRLVAIGGAFSSACCRQAFVSKRDLIGLALLSPKKHLLSPLAHVRLFVCAVHWLW
jgi:hypothetical protein